MNSVLEYPLKSHIPAEATVSTCVVHRLEIKAALEEIDTALGWLRGLAKLHQWPQRTSFGLVLSADEALTNIVTHASTGTDVGAGVIQLACSQSKLEIKLRIEDEGLPFDPAKSVLRQADSSIEDAVVGGHGLRLMRHYLKSINYSREDSRNVLTLIACLEADASA